MSALSAAGEARRIPVTVLTGFLGSGKTTLVNRLLRQPGMANTAVIVNEFGEIGLDHLLIARADENIVLLDAGCLCCTINASLRETLQDLYFRRVRAEVPPFERVIVETTGLADPGPIIQVIGNESFAREHFRLDGVVACVDAVHGAAQLAVQPEAVAQVAMADRLVITKTDLLADAAAPAALGSRLAAINPLAARLVAVHGEVDGAAIVDIGLFDQARRRLDAARWLRLPPAGDVGVHAFRHDVAIASHAVVFARPTSWAGLAAWSDLIRMRHAPDLLRVKGIVWIDAIDAPVVVHGVHRIFDAPRRLEATLPDRLSRLVVIARGLDYAALRDTLPALWPDRAPDRALAEAGIERVAA